MTGDRARLTIPDVIMLLATLAFSTPLLIVFLDGLGDNAGALSFGAVYLWRAIPGVFLLVIISIIFYTSVGGVSR